MIRFASLLLAALAGAAAPALAEQMTHAKPAHPAAHNRAKPGPKTVTLPDGLRYTDLTVGKGPLPKEGQTVVVHYVGTFPDGKKFDSSRDRGQPFEFPLGVHKVIPCWDEALATMRVGGHRKLVCPPSLAYGAAGAGGVIPPNATLDFDVELLAIR